MAMNNSYDISGKLAIDARNMDDLRLKAQQNPDHAIKEVAQHFEAIFLQMMLKSMREALPKDGLFDSQQSQFYTQMLDQQLTQNMASKGIGLADLMVQQLTRAAVQQPMQGEASAIQNDSIGAMANTENESTATAPDRPNDISASLWPGIKATPGSLNQPVNTGLSDDNKQLEEIHSSRSTPEKMNQPDEFVSAVWSHAKKAEQVTGIPAHFMVAQAALESGWGKHEIRHADSSPSFNLFGIKAGANWKGDVVETVTTEFINGIPKKTVEKFRAYNSYAEGFQDYANLLLNNPRYSAVLKNQDAAAFANGLQQAGYATDPRYADKLLRVINSSPIVRNQTI